MMEITSDAIERVGTLLADVPKGAERVFSAAINRGISRAKTQALKRVKQVYTVNNGALTSRTAMKMSKASTGNLAGFVSFAGTKLPLYQFKVTPTKPIHGKRVRAAVKKGGGTPFDEAFLADMKHGMGVYERLTSKRTPTEQLMGLSAAQMVGSDEVIDGLEEEVQEVVNERVIHEMNRILNGYGR